MKNYFKHQFGYVNLDNEYLYFTKSGNWKEARELREGSVTPISKEYYTAFSIGLGCMLFFLIIVSLFGFQKLENEILIAIVVNVLSLLSLISSRYQPDHTKISVQELINLECIQNYDTLFSRYDVLLTFNSTEGQEIKQRLWMHKFEFWALRDALENRQNIED